MHGTTCHGLTGSCSHCGCPVCTGWNVVLITIFKNDFQIHETPTKISGNFLPSGFLWDQKHENRWKCYFRQNGICRRQHKMPDSPIKRWKSLLMSIVLFIHQRTNLNNQRGDKILKLSPFFVRLSTYWELSVYVIISRISSNTTSRYSGLRALITRFASFRSSS